MADKSRKKYRFGKIFKRAMALFIIVIINFNSYAAVVSSNDGSAFITKAEFDALVNDFNSRIEDYEKSIDAKIDGAIAEYLAGLAVSSSVGLKSLIEGLNYNLRTFKIATWNGYNPSNITAGDVGIQIIRIRGFFIDRNNKDSDRYGYFLRILLNGGTVFSTSSNYSTDDTVGWWTRVYHDNDNDFYYVNDDYQIREVMHYRATNGYLASQDIRSYDESTKWDDSLDTTDSVFQNTNNSPDPVLKSYQAKIVGENVDYIAVLTASYNKGTNSSNYCGNLRTQCLNQLSSSSYWFIDGDNFNVFDGSREFEMVGSSYRRNSQVYKRTTDFKIQLLNSWGTDNQPVNISTYSTKKMQLPLTSIKNRDLSNIVGEPVNLYGGLPMCNLIGSPGKLTFKLELSEDAVVCLNYGQFGNTVVTTATTNCDKNYGVLTKGTHNLELDLSNEKWAGRKGILWLKVNKTSDSVGEITVNVSDIFIEVEM